MFQDDEHYTQSFSNTIIYEAVSDEDKPKFESEITEERISVKKTSPLQESEPNDQDSDNWPQICEQVLHELYCITRGIVHKGVYSNIIAAKLSFEMETIMDCIEYLESKELVTETSVDYHLIHTLCGLARTYKHQIILQTIECLWIIKVTKFHSFLYVLTIRIHNSQVVKSIVRKGLKEHFLNTKICRRKGISNNNQLLAIF
jgi:hypothetical protein